MNNLTGGIHLVFSTRMIGTGLDFMYFIYTALANAVYAVHIYDVSCIDNVYFIRVMRKQS